jgi:hypothetical protein
MVLIKSQHKNTTKPTLTNKEMKEETKKPNNPNAFPEVYTNGLGEIDSISGMSLLDYFAAKAMHHVKPVVYVSKEETEKSFKQTAEYVYMYANAMLKERENHI